MVNNLDSKLENSTISTVSAPDINDDEVEIDLREIFYALKKKILLILMVALIGGCGAGAYTQFMMTPIYSSTSSMLVTFERDYSYITDGSAVGCQPDQ